MNFCDYINSIDASTPGLLLGPAITYCANNPIKSFIKVVYKEHLNMWQISDGESFTIHSKYLNVATMEMLSLLARREEGEQEEVIDLDERLMIEQKRDALIDDVVGRLPYLTDTEGLKIIHNENAITIQCESIDVFGYDPVIGDVTYCVGIEDWYSYLPRVCACNYHEEGEDIMDCRSCCELYEFLNGS